MTNMAPMKNNAPVIYTSIFNPNVGEFYTKPQHNKNKNKDKSKKKK